MSRKKKCDKSQEQAKQGQMFWHINFAEGWKFVLRREEVVKMLRGKKMLEGGVVKKNMEGGGEIFNLIY